MTHTVEPIPPRTMFASSGLTEHAARGLVGIAALNVAISMSAQHPVVALAFVGIALVALRGCPVCWTIGLVETAYRSLFARRSSAS